MYQQYPYLNNNGDRQFFIPFLLGGLAGSAIVGVSRPRPVYVNSPQAYPYPQSHYRPNPYYGYGPSSYYNYTGYQQY